MKPSPQDSLCGVASRLSRTERQVYLGGRGTVAILRGKEESHEAYHRSLSIFRHRE